MAVEYKKKPHEDDFMNEVMDLLNEDYDYGGGKWDSPYWIIVSY